MNNKSSYSEKLKNPQWQKKRLEVFQRDDFTCCKCKSTSKTLHVHHISYIYGKEPWDYDLSFLLTLCEDCHLEEEENKQTFDVVLNYLESKRIFRSDIGKVLKQAYPIDWNDFEAFVLSNYPK